MKAIVLMVDDNADDALLLDNSLKKVGPEFLMARVGSGAEAIDFLKAEGVHLTRKGSPLPKLILLDLKMPSLDGLELLDWIQRDQELAAIPVVVMSGLLHEADKVAALEKGAVAVLTKPADPGELRAVLKTLLERWVLSREAGETGGLVGTTQ